MSMVVDRSGRTELHYAASGNDAAGVANLLAQGADLDARDREGFTPLHLASQEGAYAAAQALIEGGAVVDATNVYGNTPLFVAVINSRGQGDLIRLLRDAGANPHHVNASGQTPVGLARLIANYDVARFFADVA